jgi:hypothetical protein
VYDILSMSHNIRSYYNQYTHILVIITYGMEGVTNNLIVVSSS